MALGPRPGRTSIVAAVISLLVFGVFALGAFGATAQLWVVDLGEAFAAAAAALSCARHARASTRHRRRGWMLLAAGCASWAAGQALWSVYELGLGRETPFPSPADAGYLGFSVLAVLALFVLAPPSGRSDRSRRLLDGLTVACALGLISWVLVLGQVVEAGAAGLLALAISTAYPAADVVVLTVAVLALAQKSVERAALVTVSWGLVLLAVSDSLFVWQTSNDSYTTGSVDLGWTAGFVLLALAGRFAPHHVEPTQARVAVGSTSLLPYLALVCAGAVVLVRIQTGRAFDTTAAVLTAILLTLVLVRQWSAVHENERLIAVVEQRETQLRHQAFHDGLTGLANRELFADRVAHGLALARRDRTALTVGFLDLDGFKAVNDGLGHACGDELLTRVAERLRALLRPADTLARIGGDEFAFLLERCDGEAAGPLAERVLAGLREPYRLGEQWVEVSASIGLAAAEPYASAPTVDDLLRRADLAMYDVKRHGKNGVRLHAPGLRLQELEDLTLQRVLGAAIAQRRVRAVLQPVIELSTGAVSAFEVLARWEHDGREVPPQEFVAVAERTGLAPALTDLMVDYACAQLASWGAGTGRTNVVLGVNISPAELLDIGLRDRVERTLERHGVPGRQLLLEVTETGLMRDPDLACAVMASLRELGVSFALDDFGTGYSSLAQLMTLPLDSVKIDRTFIEDLDSNPARQRFLEGMLAFTRHVGLRVVAEGIERPGQLQLLRELGVTWAQGYLLGRPAPASTFDPTLLPVPAGVAVAASASVG